MLMNIIKHPVWLLFWGNPCILLSRHRSAETQCWQCTTAVRTYVVMNIIINVSRMCTRSKDTPPQKQIVNMASETRQQSAHMQDSLTGRNIRERLRRGNETPAHREQRLQARRESDQLRRQQETVEQWQQRLQARRESTCFRRRLETVEHQQHRL